MANNKIVFAIIGLIALIMIIINISIEGPKHADALLKYESNDTTFTRADEYESFTDSLLKYIDTTFYANYRFKPDRFVLMYLDSTGITSPFKVDDLIQSKIFGKAKQLQILSIWKLRYENFVRYEIYRGPDSVETLLVLDALNGIFQTKDYPSETFNSLQLGESVEFDKYESVQKISDRVFLFSKKLKSGYQ